MTATKRVSIQWVLIGVLMLGASWLQAKPDSVELRDRMSATPGQMSLADLEWIWQGLQQLSTSQLLQLSRAEDNNYFEQGWFELASAYRLAGSHNRREQLATWKRDWFHHPAIAWLERLGGTVLQTAEVPAVVTRLGVMLPLTGPYAEQGRAVLEGVREAQHWDQRQGFDVPELQVFDSQSITDPSAFIREAALKYELDMMLGPLQQSLSGQLDQPFSIPVLALNRSGGGRFNGYQLDLASDQELRQLVGLMQKEGHRRVLILAPMSETWVEPLLLWLEQQMEIAGLQSVGPYRFRAVLPELEHQLGGWLGVTRSHSRAKQLLSELSDEAVFVPRRRQDIDAVLLIARPEQARLVKPVLNYLHAGELDTYASSHVFTGAPDASSDRDLEGVRFCDMPWRLVKRSGPESSSVFFALGVDAGSLHRALPRMRSGVPGYFEGETGNLRLQSEARMERALICVRFVDGVPRPL